MAFKMKGNPAKMGMIKGTAGHSSAMKMKMEKDSAAKMKKEAAMKMKSPMEKKLVGAQNNLPEELKAKIEASPAKEITKEGQARLDEQEKTSASHKSYLDKNRSKFKKDDKGVYRNADGKSVKDMNPQSPAKQLDPKVKKMIDDFHRPTPAVKPRKLNDAQVKAIKKALKEKLKDPKTIEKLKDALKKGYTPTTPAKQQGPTPEKNPDLMKGEMEGTAVYGGKDNRERIVDLEERAGFLTDNDIPDLEGSKDPKDIKRLKQLKATVKKLQNEAAILRNRKPN
jgi:hypothetical protein